MSEVLVRPALDADLGAIEQIYAEAVTIAASSFELEPFRC